MRSIRLIAAALLFFALSTACALADGAPAATCSTVKNTDAPTQPIAQLCLYPSTTQVDGIGSADPIDDYYGVVVASTTVNDATLKTKAQGIGDFLAGIFRKQAFTAQVSVILDINTASTHVTLPERPLFILQRTSGGKTDIQATSDILAGSAITPFFALSPGSSVVTAHFKTYVTNDTTFNITTLSSAAESLAKNAGAGGWVLSQLSSTVVTGAASSAQQYIDNYFSNSQTINSTATLDFISVGSAHALQFNQFASDGKNVVSSFGVGMRLYARPSLITDVFRDDHSGHITPVLFGVGGVPPGTWAQKIVISPSTTIGITAKFLSAAINNDGVPRKLTGIDGSAPAGTSAKEVVQSACHDLYDALSGGKYFALSDTDAVLILYDQLMSAGVFSAYSFDDLQCTVAVKDVWVSRYGIPPPIVKPPVPEKDVDFASGMTPRLTVVGSAWKLSALGDRKVNLATNFEPQIHVQLMSGFSASADAVLQNAGGVTSGLAIPDVLSDQKAMCWGAFTKIAGTLNQAMVLARFDGRSDLYAVTVGFDDTDDWTRGRGPLIKDLSVRVATPSDVAAAGSDSCKQ